MVLIDIFIEPVAIELGFWAWEQNQIPIQNYIAWFLISFVLLIFFYRLPFDKKNPISSTVFYAQLMFFISINILS